MDLQLLWVQRVLNCSTSLSAVGPLGWIGIWCPHPSSNKTWFLRISKDSHILRWNLFHVNMLCRLFAWQLKTESIAYNLTDKAETGNVLWNKKEKILLMYTILPQPPHLPWSVCCHSHWKKILLQQVIYNSLDSWAILSKICFNYNMLASFLDIVLSYI